MLSQCSVGIALYTSGVMVQCLLKFSLTFEAVAFTGVTVSVSNESQSVAYSVHSVDNSVI